MAKQKRIPNVGDLLRVTWLDPCGYINEDFSKAKLTKCTSIAVVQRVEGDLLVLWTSKYEGEEHGDATSLHLGSVIEWRVLLKKKEM